VLVSPQSFRFLPSLSVVYVYVAASGGGFFSMAGKWSIALECLFSCMNEDKFPPGIAVSVPYGPSRIILALEELLSRQMIGWPSPLVQGMSWPLPVKPASLVTRAIC
jgi:hypothetical protein